MKAKWFEQAATNPLTNNKHPQPRWGGWARRTARLCLVAGLAACALTVLAGPVDVGGKKDFKVYQGNAYVGGLIEAPLALDPSDPN